jgi:hypothetical protein
VYVAGFGAEETVAVAGLTPAAPAPAAEPEEPEEEEPDEEPDEVPLDEEPAEEAPPAEAGWDEPEEEEPLDGAELPEEEASEEEPAGVSLKASIPFWRATLIPAERVSARDLTSGGTLEEMAAWRDLAPVNWSWRDL